jgi:hypothetical protein
MKIPLERLSEALRTDAADVGMLPLSKNLHPVMREVFKKTVQRKTGTVDVNFAELAVKIRVFIDQPDFQPIRTLQ